MSISFLATKGVFLSVFVYGNSQKGEIGDNNSVFTKSIVKVRSPGYQRGSIEEPPTQYLKVKYRCAIGVAFIPVWDGGIRLAEIIPD